jgi:cephalosporin-C deacetylase-like acetyl esterase
VSHGFGDETPAARLRVLPEKSRGVYEQGEPIAWTIEYQGPGSPGEVRYSLRPGGLNETKSGAVPLAEGRGRLETSLERAGAVLARLEVTPPDGQPVVALGGAIVDPAGIKPSASRPTDFDEFWDGKVSELKQTPPNARLEAKPCDKPGVEYFHVTLDGFRGTKIFGQLARPKTATSGGKLPALLIPQWAGVYPLETAWAVDRAAEGWLTLNLQAHELPPQGPVEFYARQFEGPLKNYWSIGNDDRESSYYLRMYLSCVQALEYLCSLPEWDGKTLVVSGTSQGGMQTFAAAGLDSRVTAALALVPAGCDFLGPDAGRDAGWPKWLQNGEGKDAAKVREAGRYFDAVNFASRIKCPMLVGYGLIDDVCPPEGVQAAVNQLAGPKEVVVLPLSGHQDVEGSQQPYYIRSAQWLQSLSQGAGPPKRGK